MNALLSVSDKTGIVEFAQALHALGIKLLSTGGTAKLLADKGLPVTEVAEVTQFPEMLDGRVKTLHPKVHGGLLARRELPEHMAALKEHGIDTIDLLVVNLYPFEATVAAGADDPAAIENIDIGVPAMIRAAAKNHAFVAAIVDPGDYGALLAELEANGGATGLGFRQRLAAKAFARTAAYDAAVAAWFAARTDDAAPPWRRPRPSPLSRSASRRPPHPAPPGARGRASGPRARRETRARPDRPRPTRADAALGRWRQAAACRWSRYRRQP